MRRRGLRDRWADEVERSDRIGNACRVLLLAMARRMTDAGSVSIPREQLAEMLNTYPSRITERIVEAKRAGLLDQTGGGYRGRTASYVAVLPAKKVTGERSPIAANGDGQAVTISGHLSEGSDGATRPGKVTGERSPNAGAHVRVPYERRETEPNHDDSGAPLDHVLTERRSNTKDPRLLALAAAFSCVRPSEAA